MFESITEDILRVYMSITTSRNIKNRLEILTMKKGKELFSNSRHQELSPPTDNVKQYKRYIV